MLSVILWKICAKQGTGGGKGMKGEKGNEASTQLSDISSKCSTHRVLVDHVVPLVQRGSKEQ